LLVWRLSLLFLFLSGMILWEASRLLLLLGRTLRPIDRIDLVPKPK
jgi:hypothetical protein